MNLELDTDYLRLLNLDQLFELLEKLESKKAITTPEYKLVLKEIEGRK